MIDHKGLTDEQVQQAIDNYKRLIHETAVRYDWEEPCSNTCPDGLHYC